MIIGTGLIADFPTTEGNLYTRDCLEKLVNDSEFQGRVARGEMVGGVLNTKTLEPIGDIITHRVRRVEIFNGEIIVDIELIDNPESKSLVESINKLQAAVVVMAPEKILSGMKIVKIDRIRAIHLREEKTVEITND